MSGNSYGQLFKITTFGESHGKSLGVIIDGVPPGLSLSLEKIQLEMNRRRPGQSDIVTPRDEPDRIQIHSGIFEGKTTGTALMLQLQNRDQISKDYKNIKDTFRPGHADFTYHQKYGFRDYRGGGRSSGRETAARVAAGAIAKQFLEKLNIKITAHTQSIGNISCEKYQPETIEQNIVRAADLNSAKKMIKLIEKIQLEGDSIGGIVECRISGVPAGLGEPVFDKIDAELAKAMISLGTTKGIEFGDGFKATLSRGSENNDQKDKTGYLSNHAGGIEGGLTNGNEIIFRVAIKPTASISIPQKTINKMGEEHQLIIKGRHDPCICPRIVPVIEAMAAIVLFDFYLRQKSIKESFNK